MRDVLHTYMHMRVAGINSAQRRTHMETGCRSCHTALSHTKGGLARQRCVAQALHRPAPSLQVYVCAAFLACWERDICSREFQDLILFLQKLPTQDWQESDIESVLSSAFVLRNTWGSAKSHLQA